ncbi:MAG: ATP-binding protein [Magnetococcales bacterium]|nr:ATP-binding protein [Magnetococcales bacterium]
MTITSLEIHDGDWHLQETCFNTLNLLVGISGVGKSRLLKAIQKICRAGIVGMDGLHEYYDYSDCSWAISFNVDGQHYRWKANTSTNCKIPETDNSPRGLLRSPIFLYESIELNETLCISRNYSEGIFLFNEMPLPKLKWTESAISILRNEPGISKIYRTIKRINASNEINNWHSVDYGCKIPTYNTLLDIQSDVNTPLIIKFFCMRDKFVDHFNEIKYDFVNIFPFVEDIAVKKTISFKNKHNIHDGYYFIAIKEINTDKWISGKDISTGMLRTLKIILELFLAPKGSVFLIDEFENSLGVNCLPQVAEAVRTRQGEIQFFLTSHHPYVINNIPWNCWKVVTRQGSNVTIRNAQQIPELQTASSMDRFFLLLNSESYREGIQ